MKSKRTSLAMDNEPVLRGLDSNDQVYSSTSTDIIATMKIEGIEAHSVAARAAADPTAITERRLGIVVFPCRG